MGCRFRLSNKEIYLLYMYKVFELASLRVFWSKKNLDKKSIKNIL